MDDTDLVHKKTQRTMVNIHKKTMGDVKKHLHAFKTLLGASFKQRFRYGINM